MDQKQESHVNASPSKFVSNHTKCGCGVLLLDDLDWKYIYDVLTIASGSSATNQGQLVLVDRNKWRSLIQDKILPWCIGPEPITIGANTVSGQRDTEDSLPCRIKRSNFSYFSN